MYDMFWTFYSYAVFGNDDLHATVFNAIDQSDVSVCVAN